MIKTTRCLLCAGVAALLGATATPASAQAIRTWVSGVGDDVNPCSRTAPCKTFAGAISKTSSGGEINCLDPGGFGSVTIVKPIAIICGAADGGVLAGGHGITVNLPNGSDHVLLSGLHIMSTNPPGSGVRIIGSGTVHLHNSTVSGFKNSDAVTFAPTGSASLLISGSTISASKTGIAATKPGQVVVADSFIAGNVTGLATSGGGKIVSGGNNLLVHNGSDGSFSSTKARQ